MNRLSVLLAACAVVYGAYAVLMGVVPGVVLSETAPAPHLQPLTPQEAAGRDVYVSEGCAYCHTQNVRPLHQDLVFGRPSIAGDYAYSTPQLLGTERTGPDLSNIGVRQPSEVWQYIHLWNPRSVVSGSIMPPYPWLFTVKDRAGPQDVVVSVPAAYAPAHGVVTASVEAQDLVAYLKSLKQVTLSSGGAR